MRYKDSIFIMNCDKVNWSQLYLCNMYTPPTKK